MEKYTLLFSILVIVNGFVLTTGNNYCWDFETGLDIWTNTGLISWISSTTSLPDTTNILYFSANSQYVWLQDQVGAPNTGTIETTPTNGVLIYPGDEVSVDIWRHINYDDGSYRPVLVFNSLGSTVHNQHILWSYNQDVWETVSITCGPEAEPCCLTYPCQGYFSLDGSILARDELLAVDNIRVNGPCGQEV